MIQEIQGNRYEASTHFRKVVDLKPNDYDLLFSAQLKRALNFDVDMESSEVVYNELERMLKDDKNIDLRDQIYYVMALIAIEDEDYERAEEFLDKSVRVSTTNKAQKGVSFTKRAELSFMFKEYVDAQAYYDSAYISLPPAHEKYPEVEVRKNSLTDLVENLNIVATQDSLQRLANMSLARQREVIEDYIVWLKDEEERLMRERELAELNAELASQSQSQDGGPQVGGGRGWYFYNSGVRSNGISTFAKRWGSRDLEDNWRQKTKSAKVLAEQDIAVEGDSASTGNGLGNAPVGGQKYDPEYYLAQIPKDSADMAASNKLILDAYIALGGDLQ